MRQSLFFDITGRYLPELKRIIEMRDGKRKPPVYLHESMLRTEYSVTQEWKTNNVDATSVSADIVALDSSVPVKMRDAIRSYGGNLPTIAIRYGKNAVQINELNIIKSQGTNDELVRKLMSDAIKCHDGLKEATERYFLEGLSNGAVGVASEDVGGEALVRIDYGYLSENMHKVAKPWTATDATPLSDITAVMDKAEGGVETIMMDKSAFERLRASREGAELVARAGGIAVSTTSKLMTPTRQAFLDAFAGEYGAKIIVVDRRISVERYGKRTRINPWNKNKVIFLASEQVGAIVYGTHPEELQKSADVTITKPLQYAFVRNFSTADPLTEITEGKGIYAPIIEGVDLIHSLDITQTA